ncbi:hypothetical protein C0993_001499 [Termitomyces sp. T159_Od127]|nr:hypothetical protein C0993_001499 [Termitomyces sp. T159_Od127]
MLFSKLTSLSLALWASLGRFGPKIESGDLWFYADLSSICLLVGMQVGTAVYVTNQLLQLGPGTPEPEPAPVSIPPVLRDQSPALFYFALTCSPDDCPVTVPPVRPDQSPALFYFALTCPRAPARAVVPRHTSPAWMHPTLFNTVLMCTPEEVPTALAVRRPADISAATPAFVPSPPPSSSAPVVVVVVSIVGMLLTTLALVVVARRPRVPAYEGEYEFSEVCFPALREIEILTSTLKMRLMPKMTLTVDVGRVAYSAFDVALADYDDDGERVADLGVVRDSGVVFDDCAGLPFVEIVNLEEVAAAEKEAQDRLRSVADALLAATATATPTPTPAPQTYEPTQETPESESESGDAIKVKVEIAESAEETDYVSTQIVSSRLCAHASQTKPWTLVSSPAPFTADLVADAFSSRFGPDFDCLEDAVPWTPEMVVEQRVHEDAFVFDDERFGFELERFVGVPWTPEVLVPAPVMEQRVYEDAFVFDAERFELELELEREREYFEVVCLAFWFAAWHD